MAKEKTTPAKGKAPELYPVEEVTGVLPGWEAAALMAAAGWAPGKQVSKQEFGSAMARFRNRPQGGGRI